MNTRSSLEKEQKSYFILEASIVCTVQLNKKLSLPRTNYRPQGTLQGTSPQYRVLRFTSGTGQWVVRGTLQVWCTGPTSRYSS